MDPVREYMVTVIKEVDADASVRDAAKKLCEFGIGSLLVKKDGNFIGMVSEQEITRQLVGADKDSSSTNVSEIMNSDIDYIDQSEIMTTAIAIMREKRLRYLVVRDGELVKGILSVKDLLVYYEKWFKGTSKNRVKSGWMN